ncbi:MAG TPA: AMP-binding protein [Micromonosporaceae bacterium]|nr:AMP-binding protein [Micromonosporaceae bacterium]
MLAGTLHETLDEAAAKSPDVLTTFPGDPAALSLLDLAASSALMAAGLWAAGVRAGDRVGILCRNEPHFVQALFAVSRLGAAACPLPLPATIGSGAEQHTSRLRRIAATAHIRHVVVTERLGALAAHLGTALPGVRLLPAGGLLAGAVGRPVLPGVDPAAVAVVQFTSGTTQQPRGVRLSHCQVLAGLDAIGAGLDIGPGDRGSIWLPLYHDMGLFGLLSGLLVGAPTTLWSPMSFVRAPGRWLRAFAEERATICPSPNFGYDYLLGAVGPDEAATLDLSHWRVALNGSETVAPDSVTAFLDRFAPAGFRPEAMLAAYGLAEATLAVTLPPLDRGPVFDRVDAERLVREGVVVPAGSGGRVRSLTALGRAVPGMALRITDPATGAVLPDERVGELRIRGASVTSGYLTDDPSAAGPAQATRPFAGDGWLRTGDLGYLRRGELFLTGRLKEMIVVRGVNYHPEDVEGVVRAMPGIYRRMCVAFPGEGESMVLAAETPLTEPDDRGRLAADIATEVRRATGLSGLRVHLLPPRSIPRTTSGKLQRLATRELVDAAPPEAT